jgi:Protein of unknown function (DUF3592)
MILLFLTGALICFIGAAIWSFLSYQLTTRGVRVQAEITQVIQRNGSNGDYFCPVFSFQTKDGTRHTVTSGIGSYPPAYRIGDTVSVLYYPWAPDSARLDNWFELWGAPIFIAVFGVVNLIGGLITQKWPAIVARLRGHRLTPLSPQR